MLYKAKSGTIKIENEDMDFISFGKGDKSLVMIPGLSDGLRTVKGMATTMALLYRCYAKNYVVYVISRKNQLKEGYSTRDMAADYKKAMEKLAISKADIIGISQGGMIAQYIAIDYPEVVEKLVLAVTLSKQNETVQKVVSSFIKMAELNDYKSIIIDTSEKSYTEKRLKRYRPLYPLLCRFGKPKDLKRFIIQANACISHDAYNELEKIECPTLVIGVDDDKIVGNKTSEEISERIKGSKLIIYEGFGHLVSEEAKDFNLQVLEFLK